MTVEPSFRTLMRQLVAGSEDAAARVVAEYTTALMAVARREIGPKLARRIDPEDAVQSAYRSFFVRAGRGDYELSNGQELWKLLLTITLNKVRRQGKFHHAQKRNVASDQSAAASQVLRLTDLAVSEEPGPEDAAMLVDEVAAVLATLPAEDRPIIELRLQGHNSVQIAKETGRAERSVRRILERVGKRLERDAGTG